MNKRMTAYRIPAIIKKAFRLNREGKNGVGYLEDCRDFAEEWDECSGWAVFTPEAINDIRTKHFNYRKCKNCGGL